MNENYTSYIKIESQMNKGYTKLSNIIQCNCEYCDINKSKDFTYLLNYLNKVIQYGYYIKINKQLCKNIEIIIKTSSYLSEGQYIYEREKYIILRNKCLLICYENEDVNIESEDEDEDEDIDLL